VRHVILPERNAADLVDVPEEVLSSLTVHFARTLDDVLEVALLPAAPLLDWDAARPPTKSERPGTSLGVIEGYA
jgi:hypothetical protein